MTGLAWVGRYWHTLRYLRPVQFYGRLWFRMWRPRPGLATAPAVRIARGHWATPARREPSLTHARHFLFLGVGGRLEDVGWDGPLRDKLWRYNQHYFDDLNACAADARAAWHLELLLDWVEHNPPGQGNAWEPYPTSLRIVNWIKWALAGYTLPTACVHSLAVQVRWLYRRMEFHLLGNHLFSNAKALVFAGLFFSGREAERWLQRGMGILRQEVAEQILADGGHFERSTMYHALAFEDMLDLCNLLVCHAPALSKVQKDQAERWSEVAAKMHVWLNAMCHPDGEIGFFNDAAFGIAPSCRELGVYCARLGLPTPQSGMATWLKDSGYARLQSDVAVALLDMAPVGPDYLPGHAHADTLGFELSVHGQRVLVQSGTSCYGVSAERLRQRGTAAHNSVVVNGQDSSEVWGGFRVARRARPISPAVTLGPGTQLAQCAHDGFTRLPGRPVHQRRWALATDGLQVDDLVIGRHENAQAMFHFHPEAKLTWQQGAQSGEIVLPTGEVVRWSVSTGSAQVVSSSWHPTFGEVLPSQCLVLDLVDGVASLQFFWTR